MTKITNSRFSLKKDRFFLGAFLGNVFSPKGAQKKLPKMGLPGGQKELSLPPPHPFSLYKTPSTPIKHKIRKKTTED